MVTLTSRIANDNVRAESVMTDAPTHAWDEGSPEPANWYRVTLTRKRRRMTVPFGMGSALTSEPSAHDVLSALLSDAASIENSRSFEEWADELGFDEDSRKAEKTYNADVTQTEKLKEFLGDDYQAYLWETEND